MSIMNIIVPNVAESVTEATIGKWLKKNGEYVQQDEIIVELETDKATQEFPAEHSGILNIIAEEGTVVQVGEIIAKIDTSATNSAKPEPKIVDKPAMQLNEPKSTGQVLQMNVPAVGESITEVTIANWLKKDGDFIKLDDVLCEIESDKATFELTSEANGKLKIMAQPGETLSIGAPICQIEVFDGNIESTVSHTNEISPVDAKPNHENYANGHPSPAASKILAEKGINPNDVNGTGIEGRITKEDAINAMKNPEVKPLNKKSKPDDDALNLNNSVRTEERKKMTSLRKTISKRLVAVKNETAMLTTFNEVDMKPIMDIRKKYKDSFKDKFGVGLGFMSFFTKAVCEALQAWPAVGAQIDGDEIIYPNYCDVSIAVSTPKGLVVPVIRNAEKLSFDQIEKEIMALAIKARDGKLSIEEMTGGTFTITNGGIFGSMLSTPIINAPQAAILGMHNIVERPVAINGQVEIRPIMYLALSYDHRIIDGKESVSFLKMVKELLEDPTRMLLGI